ncbi:hypothetical protein TNCT_273851, partial [Trichonephila clavata]
ASKPYERERLQVCDALRCPGPHVRYSRGDNVRRCLGRRAWVTRAVSLSAGDRGL